MIYMYLIFLSEIYNDMIQYFEREKYSSCQICQMKFKLIFIKFLLILKLLLRTFVYTEAIIQIIQ